MRLMSIILTGYFLLLMAGPCCIMDAFERSVTDKCCKAAPVKSEDTPKEEAPCSPFYACSACTGFMVQADMRLELVNIAAVPFFQQPGPPLLLHPLESIWQPPKMA